MNRPLTIVFAVLRPVYLRYFDSTIRLLAQRGHTVHLSFSASATDGEDLSRARALAEEESGVAFGIGPRRSDGDMWRLTAAGLRLLGDFGRYLGPEFRDAQPLRARAERVLLAALSSNEFPAPARATCALFSPRQMAVRCHALWIFILESLLWRNRWTSLPGSHG